MSEFKAKDENKSKRVLVAMSGGVDSSVAAAILKVQGYEVLGVHMQLWDSSGTNIKKSGGSCCSIVDSNDARKVCAELDIPYYVMNARDEFKAEVIDYFVNEYLSARTPNPCVMCNNKLKYRYLVQKADELKCDYVATGHYSKVVLDHATGAALLLKATDRSKDQSYFLFGLKQEQLKRALMPLGDLLKSNVRKLAQTFNLPVADKKDSMEICFVDEDGYKPFVEENAAQHFLGAGPIMDHEGVTVGRHTGIYKYTIGQKRGLGLTRTEHQNWFVIGFDRNNNSVIVGPEQYLFRKVLAASACNWIGHYDFTHGLKCKARIRSRHEEADCMITLLKADTCIVEFSEAQRAITPGQAIVFYQDEICIGGGWIDDLNVGYGATSNVKSRAIASASSSTSATT